MRKQQNFSKKTKGHQKGEGGLKCCTGKTTFPEVDKIKEAKPLKDRQRGRKKNNAGASGLLKGGKEKERVERIRRGGSE